MCRVRYEDWVNRFNSLVTYVKENKRLPKRKEESLSVWAMGTKRYINNGCLSEDKLRYARSVFPIFADTHYSYSDIDGFLSGRKIKDRVSNHHDAKALLELYFLAGFDFSIRVWEALWIVYEKVYTMKAYNYFVFLTDLCELSQDDIRGILSSEVGTTLLSCNTSFANKYDLAKLEEVCLKFINCIPNERRRVSILKMYYGLGEYNKSHTLREVGNEFSLSAERVRQLRNLAFWRLLRRKNVILNSLKVEDDYE